MNVRNLKLMGIAAAGLLAAGCDLKGNVYPLTPQQAYEKLVAAPVVRSDTGPFGMLDVSPTGDGGRTVYWVTTSGETLCEADVKPEGSNQTRIMAWCGGGSSGATTGMLRGMYRSAIIEHIDAALNGRPYDPARAPGSTAATWPDDPRQEDGSLGAAVGEAARMDAEAHGSQENTDPGQQTIETSTSQQDVNFTPGQPMVNTQK